MKIKHVLTLGLILTILTGATVYAETDIEAKASELSQSLYNIIIDLQSKVEDGTITQERADSIIENLEKRLDSLEAFDFDNRKINNGKNMKNINSHQVALIYAELTGMDIEEVLETCKESEKSIFTLAYENGIYDELVDTIIEETEERLNQAVEEGKITQDKVDEFLTNLKSNLEVYDPDNTFLNNFMLRRENTKNFNKFNKREGKPLKEDSI